MQLNAIGHYIGNAYTQCTKSRSPDICDKALSNGKVGIDEHGNAHGSRQQFMQEPKPLCPKLHHHEADTGDVATWPVEAGDEAVADRIAAGCEDDRDRRGCGLGRNCRRGVGRSDHCHLTAYQIGCEVGQSIVLVLRPAILDRHILAFDVPGLECTPWSGQVGDLRIG